MAQGSQCEALSAMFLRMRLHVLAAKRFGSSEPAWLLHDCGILNPRLFLAPHGTLDSIACLAATIIAISIGPAVVEVSDRLLLVAAPAELDGYI